MSLLVYASSYSLTPLTVATLNPVTMETLQLFRGDTIIVRFVLDSLIFGSKPYASSQWEEAAGHCSHLSELGRCRGRSYTGEQGRT